MPEWLNTLANSQSEPEVKVLLTRLLLAWFCGAIVAWIARSQKPAGTRDTLTLTLILMSILIAMATQIIGDNIARAFSLVGALSIVRFRTAVPATRDVAFVLAAVVVGMAAGAGQYWVAGMGLLVVSVATQVNRLTSQDLKTNSNESNIGNGTQGTWRLTLVVGLSSTSGWETEIKRLSESFQLTSAETKRRGGALELTYRLVPKSDASSVELVAALNAVPTVESVATKIS